MKTYLAFPFSQAIQEIKENKKQIQMAKEDGIHINLYPFIFAGYMFIFIMTIMYISILYLLIGTVVEPVGIIMLIPFLVSAWLFTIIYTKVFPKVKENYLKHVGFYDEY
ncbi:hypothetical protein [Paraliobacillus ryukyuensis]|uniref:hypothetical protein n=1 Tax=Paraliobacillus ryukyuensis TaxID=200904 RepID=UPI0009A77816|nr:hypothetical protein [Paraliobacillus ryukyuensis]